MMGKRANFPPELDASQETVLLNGWVSSYSAPPVPWLFSDRRGVDLDRQAVGQLAIRKNGWL